MEFSGVVEFSGVAGLDLELICEMPDGSSRENNRNTSEGSSLISNQEARGGLQATLIST